MQLEFMTGYGILLGYFVVCASSALVLRRHVTMPTEAFRKTLHIILLGSILVFTYGFRTWWIAASAAVVFVGMVYPILAFAERIPGYSELGWHCFSVVQQRNLPILFAVQPNWRR